MEDFTGPDFGNGFPVDRLPDGGMIQGKINGEDMILARTGGEFFAVGAGCTHYHGPLIKGLIVGDSCGAHCITPVSVSEPGKRCALRRSTRSPVGASSGSTIPYSYARNCRLSFESRRLLLRMHTNPRPRW